MQPSTPIKPQPSQRGDAAKGPLLGALAEIETALTWAASGRKVALATVVETWGSAPRPKGSWLVVREDGLFEGSVSGGCVEGAVVTAALDLLDAKAPKRLEFGVSDETAWNVGLACGGKISILVEAAPRQKLDALKTFFNRVKGGEDAALATDMATGESVVVGPGESGPLAKAAGQALAKEESSLAEADGKRFFINVVPRPRRLYLVGAVHIAKALAPLAGALGYRVTVIDPRGAFAERERFPGVRIVEDWPDEVLARETPDAATAVVTLTHDPKLDDAALTIALKSPAFYIGSLGSRKTHAARLARLSALGFSTPDLARIHGPVGLAIGAATPSEIAVAVLAEITAVRRLKGSANT